MHALHDALPVTRPRPSPQASPVPPAPAQAPDAQRALVSEYYGETLQASADLRTSACCTAKPPAPEVLALLRAVPEEIRSK